MSKPVRIQRKRTKGWKMPPNTVCVTRPGRWGNPFPRDHDGTAMHCLSLAIDGQDTFDRATAAVDLFRAWMTGGKVNELVACFLPKLESAPALRIVVRELRGKNLACFCALDQPCHADVLLELANPLATLTKVPGHEALMGTTESQSQFPHAPFIEDGR